MRYVKKNTYVPHKRQRRRDVSKDMYTQHKRYLYAVCQKRRIYNAEDTVVVTCQKRCIRNTKDTCMQYVKRYVYTTQKRTVCSMSKETYIHHTRDLYMVCQKRRVKETYQLSDDTTCVAVNQKKRIYNTEETCICNIKKDLKFFMYQLSHDTMCCDMLQCVAVCCSVLQHVAAHKIVRVTLSSSLLRQIFSEISSLLN